MADNSDNALQEKWAISVTNPLAWGEMDAFGHLNNIVYFRYFENARMAYFDRLGLQANMQETGHGPILAHTECRFRIPLTYPDTITTDSRITEIQDDRFLMEYRVRSQRANAVAAQGSGRVVWLNYKTGKKAALPASVREAISGVEGRDLPVG